MRAETDGPASLRRVRCQHTEGGGAIDSARRRETAANGPGRGNRGAAHGQTSRAARAQAEIVCGVESIVAALLEAAANNPPRAGVARARGQGDLP